LNKIYDDTLYSMNHKCLFNILFLHWST